MATKGGADGTRGCLRQIVGRGVGRCRLVLAGFGLPWILSQALRGHLPLRVSRMNLLAELRRRHVVRVCGLYLVAAWLIVQVGETVLPIFDTPGWVLKALVAVLAVGFIPAALFAWAFEMTPEGLKRESEIDSSQAVVDHTARRLDIAVMVLLLGIGGLFLWGPRPAVRDPVHTSPASVQPAADLAASAFAQSSVGVPHDKSIAVLPFADFSPAGDQAWFADGLAEEILNGLARTPDLQVSARTSSFRYKGSELAIPQIAAELRVAHVLEGSVRSTPQRVRVSAQLIRAADGFHVWSQNYDRDVADMIEIQEDLARQIATAMQTSMDPQALADMAAVGTRSVEAYQAYIRGVAKVATREPDQYQEAYALFEEARRLDPSFSSAHAQAAEFWLTQLNPALLLASLSDVSTEEMGLNYDERIGLAIVHATNDIDRLKHRASKAYRDLRLHESIELYRAYMVERPNDVEAVGSLLRAAAVTSDMDLLMNVLDTIWSATEIRIDFAIEHVNVAHRRTDKAKAAEQALLLARRWPDSRPLLFQVHRALLWDGRVDEARAVLQQWRSVTSPGNSWSMLPPARQACAEGRRREVEDAPGQTPEDDHTQRWLLLMLFGRLQEANEPLHALERDGDIYGLHGFLVYPEFDPRPFPSLMALLEREKIDRPPPAPLPFACPPARPAA
jgi:TolB-like protein